MQHFRDFIRVFAALQLIFCIYPLNGVQIKSTRFPNSSLNLGFSVFNFNFL